MSADIVSRRRIAESLLGDALDADGFAPCPGAHLHTGRSGRRDFKVILSGPPSAHCFHGSCGDVVAAFNLELRRRIAAAERGGDEAPRPPSILGNGVAPPPQAPRRLKRPQFDAAKLAQFAAQSRPEITLDWLAARSPVALPPASPEATAKLFLDSMYEPGELVLIFTRFYSQGDFIWWTGAGCHRLAEHRDVAPVESPLPQGGPEGVWFLNQPVSGEWKINHAASKGDDPRWSRRHGDCVSSWRYLVLESDVADPGLWLRALVLLPLPIAAIYTSGGKSVHALVRVDAEDKPSFDALRDELAQVVCPLGADGAAMTAVRLSRLPGMMRHGTKDKAGVLQRYESPRLQRLVWLNPEPSPAAIVEIAK